MAKTITRDRLLLQPRTFSVQNSIAPDGSTAYNVLTSRHRKNFLPVGSGGAQGFNVAADIIEQTIDGVNTNDLWNAYTQAVALRNRERQPLMDFLTYSVTNPVEGIPAGAGGARFERSSEFGVPRSHRPTSELQFMGFDFNWHDMANRFTWEFLADATAAQVDAVAQTALEADNVLMFEEIMWTLFNNENRNVEINTRPYNVYAFYNGDGTVPPEYRTNTFQADHNHYLVSGAATVYAGDAANGTKGDLDDMIEALEEHGYTRQRGADIVIMVNKEQGDMIRNWRSVANGGTALFDFIPAQNTPSFLLPLNFRTPDGASGQAPAPTLRGMTVIGSYGVATIVQEDYIPAGYMVGFATGGPESVQNPVGIREHANPALRGLRLVKGRSDDYPLQEAIYQRGFGTGIRHRGAGVVMAIGTATEFPDGYAPPAEYSVRPS